MKMGRSGDQKVLSIYRDRSPLRHGLDRVDNQVIDYLSDLADIGGDRLEGVRHYKFACNVRTA